MSEQPRRLVWDLPVRLFHWTLTLSLAGSWITAESGIEWTQWHMYLGYLALGLILFRVLWGFVGTRHARFGQFLSSPVAAARYAATLPSRKATRYAGHNPLGGWMVVLLLALVGLQAGTGIFISDDIMYAGPYNGAVSGSLADRLSYIHHLNFKFLQAAVAIHVLAVLYYWLRKRVNLVGPMFSGRKDADGLAATDAITSIAWVRGLLVAAIVAALVTALVLMAPPPAPPDFF